MRTLGRWVERIGAAYLVGSVVGRLIYRHYSTH